MRTHSNYTRRIWCGIIFFISATQASTAAFGGYILNQYNPPPDQILNAGPTSFSAVLLSQGQGVNGYVNYLSSASFDAREALARDFGGWTFVYHEEFEPGLSGVMNIKKYDAYASNRDDPDGEATGGGAIMIAEYTLGANDPAIASLEYINIVFTTHPYPGATSPYVDPPTYAPNEDDLPFYYNSNDYAGIPGLKSGNKYTFGDQPWRAAPPRPNHGYAYKGWKAETLLASWDGIRDANGFGTVNVYDAFEWGFTISTIYVTGFADGSPGMASVVPEPNSACLVILGCSFVGIVLSRARISRWRG